MIALKNWRKYSRGLSKNEERITLQLHTHVIGKDNKKMISNAVRVSSSRTVITKEMSQSMCFLLHDEAFFPCCLNEEVLCSVSWTFDWRRFAIFLQYFVLFEIMYILLANLMSD